MNKATEDNRRAQLLRLLDRHFPVLAKDVAQQWGCHERLVRRMLTRMRDEEGLPLERFQTEDRTAAWRYCGTVVQIPPLVVRDDHRRALLFSLQAAAQLDGTPVRNQIAQVYENLLATLPPERATSFRQMMRQVRFAGPNTPAVKPDVWAMLLLCLEGRETIHITYTDGVYGKPTWRDIDPYGLIMRDRRWVLVAYCHFKKQVLTFSLHRIKSADSTDRSFTMPEGFMDHYLEDAFDGYQSTDEKSEVRLRIRKDAPPFVQERQWSNKEKRSDDGDGGVLVEFKTAALWAVQREVMANAPWVEVIRPASLRQQIKATAAQLARMSK